MILFVVWQILLNVPKDHITIIFRIKVSKKSFRLLTLKKKALQSLEISENNHSVAQYSIPKDLNLLVRNGLYTKQRTVMSMVENRKTT